jgi:N utilization substance protein A
MMVALGEEGIKSMEDFAGCASDDLVGWRERKEGETVMHDGIFTPFGISRAEAEDMVVAARLAVGWITEEDLRADEEEEEAEETVEEQAPGEAGVVFSA